MKRFFLVLLLAGGFAATHPAPARADGTFDLQFQIPTPQDFTPNQLSILNASLAQVEQMWENMLTGYQTGIVIGTVPIQVYASNSGLASASYSSSTFQQNKTLSTSGFVNINSLQIEPFANWQGDEPNGLNFIDELMAHEVGHVLGIGTQWTSNGVYNFNSFQYTGAFGVAAYAAEFSDSIPYTPVENAGFSGTPNAHWDQRMRSSNEEGTGLIGGDPFLLDPRVFVTDPFGRDRSLEMMTGAIDPDWREPFISRTTVQSFRDLGYTVTEFEDFNGDGAINLADRGVLLANMGMTGLQINSMCFGDADRDRDVDVADLVLWRIAANAPEPCAGVLGALAAMALLSGTRKRVGASTATR